MQTNYSYNDWRNYTLAHSSRYDWSTGKNPPDYNHDYWEKNKDEIMAKRKQRDGAVRDFDGAGVGNKARSADGTSYENEDDWSDKLTPEELENIKLHNQQIDTNIAELKKTVEDYIAANKDKLSADQISKLRSDLNTQIEIANEQRISTRNSDDRKYVMDLRKQAQASASAKPSSSSSSKSSSGSSSKSTSKSNSTTQQQNNQAKKETNEVKKSSSKKKFELDDTTKTTNPTHSSDYDQMAEERRKLQTGYGKQSTNKTAGRPKTTDDVTKRQKVKKGSSTGNGKTGNGRSRFG